MIGQGGPSPSHQRVPFCARKAACWGCWLLLVTPFVFLLAERACAEEAMRIRIAWGGGAEAQWQGIVALSEGTLSEPRLLGIEADEPGSMWLDRGPLFAGPPGRREGPSLPGLEMDHLVIRQRSPRTYDGVELLVTAPPDAKLLIAISTPQGQTGPEWITIPLAELSNGFHASDLDGRGNRLFVSRSTGDTLRVRVGRRSLVFDPGETLDFELEPRLLPFEPGTKVRIRIELAEARGSRGRLIAEHVGVAGEFGFVEQGRTGPIRHTVRLPDEEGVYDLVLTATHAGWLRRAQPVRGKEELPTRKIQVVVLSRERPVVPAADPDRLEPVEEIDPANPKWWEKLPAPKPLPRIWKDPLGNGYSQTRKHPLGQVVQLAPASKPGDVPWEAYTLPIDRPGLPHVLELYYPSDVSQTMGLSIVEPNAAGAIFPYGLDSGIDLARPLTGPQSEPQWLRHRVTFWPKTKSPMVLITNLRSGSPAVYGKIRVLAAGEHLPRLFDAEGSQPERLLAGYLDRPLFPENFSAGESKTASSGLGADDWVTFYQGGTRLVEYLNHVGFNGLMISVLAHGSAIYPSAVLQPTPLYDTGVFEDLGQDPVRKDVLEMLFRLFDREGLKLIPAMDFSGTLPVLEAKLRRDEPGRQGLVWVGPDGRTWLETHRPVRAMAPYYNVLHPWVQEAMLAAAGELVASYGHHPSFAGLAIQLSAHGYAQLPGPHWGMDDATIAEFERHLSVRLPGEGQDRFARRAQLLSEEYREEWLAWRAEQMRGFYGRIQEELAKVRPGARLYLAGAHMFDGDDMRLRLRPTLPRRMTIAEAMLEVGIDIGHYAHDGRVVLLRPEQVTPHGSLARQAVNLEIRQMLDAQQDLDMKRPFEAMPIPGSLFFHRPEEIRLASFDEKSPFKPSLTLLAAQPLPSGLQNRRRFVHSLATLDAQVMLDGGWQLPLGQEDSIRDLAAAYRRLPAVGFQRLSDPAGSDPAQPVTIRYATHQNAMYIYLVNDAPFPAAVRLEVAAPSDAALEELSGLRQVPPLKRDGTDTSWTVRLEPYDLIAVRLPAAGVTLSKPEVWWPEEVAEAIRSKIDGLYDRAGALRNSAPPRLDVLENPGFELPPTEEGRISGWVVSSPPGTTIELDTGQKHEGLRAVRMASRGPSASLKSQPFDPPSTGRLTMSVWLRGADAASPPPLQLVLAGFFEGRSFFRFAVPQVGTSWGHFLVHVDDLPLEGLSSLRVHFELRGPGEVWIDDAELSSLVFDDGEKTAMIKLIAPAKPLLENGQIRDCMQLLEGYWPQFLLANVPFPSVARRPAPPPRPQKAPERPGFFDRMKGLVPDKLRLF